MDNGRHNNLLGNDDMKRKGDSSRRLTVARKSKKRWVQVGDFIRPLTSTEIFCVVEILSGGKDKASNEFVVACKVKNGVPLKRVIRYRGSDWLLIDTDQINQKQDGL